MSKKTSNILKLLFFLFLVAGTVVILYRSKTTPYQENKGKIFGTYYHIKYQSSEDLDAQILEQLNNVNKSLSTFDKNSTISCLNSNKSDKADKMFETVFKCAMKISEETDGAFDITVAPLVNAWGFGFRNEGEVSAQLIDSLKAFVGYQKVTLSKGKIVKQVPELMMDCSGIAKGYGCDVIAKFLQQHGIRNYMVEIGGEVCTHGVNAKNEVWKVGVTKPQDDSLAISNEVQTIMELKDKALATSGNYRNFYYKDGKKYAHTIDPHTGYPVQHSILSSTVIAPNCTLADGYATAFMVMGLEKAKQFLTHHSELKAYFIYADKSGKNKVWSNIK